MLLVSFAERSARVPDPQTSAPAPSVASSKRRTDSPVGTSHPSARAWLAQPSTSPRSRGSRRTGSSVRSMKDCVNVPNLLHPVVVAITTQRASFPVKDELL